MNLNSKNSSTKPRKKGVSRLLEIAGKKKLLLIVSAVLAVIHALLNLIPYILVFFIIRELTQSVTNFSMAGTYILYAVIAAVVSMVIFYISIVCSHIAAFNILRELRKYITQKVGEIPMGYLNNRNSGEFKKILSDDVERIEAFIAHQIPDFVKGATLPLLTLAYLFWQDWRLAAVSFVPLLILIIWLPIMYGKRNTELIRNYHSSLEEMNSGIVEYVRAMPVMKVFGQSADTFQKYGKVVQNFGLFLDRWIRSSTPPFAVFMSFTSNALLPVLVLGTYLYFENAISLPTFLLFMILGTGYIKPLFVLSNITMQLSLINRGVERIDELIYKESLPESNERKMAIGNSVSFENVTFSYEDTPVLRNVSFEVKQGSIVALVGPSGAGKSTVGQLLARFWDPDEGKILLGRINLKEFPTEQLMEKVSFVFQDSFMFQQSMYENISMGMNRTFHEVCEAAKAAQIHDLIMSLPNGYETLFGQAGVHLSGGEQQRFQLARAILKNAPVLVLDEATAFADPENESKIQEAFSELIKNKTVLIIAHRLSTVTDADEILVFDKGMIVNRGSHLQLLEDSKLYQRMWNAHSLSKEFVI